MDGHERTFLDASSLLDEGQFDDARMIYTDLLAAVEGQDQARALALRGFAWYREGRFPEALSDFSKAIDLIPGAMNTLFLRAKCREELDDPVGALSDYEAITELAPMTADAWENASMIYRYLGRSSDAANALGMAERARK